MIKPVNNLISQKDLNTPIRKSGGDYAPLPLLPEREWLSAGIVDVEYCIAEFNGVIQYVIDKNGEQIKDDDGNPIPRKQFKITFEFMDYKMSNGSPRKAWLSIGASFHEKATLPKLLKNLGINAEEMTPKEIIHELVGLEVLLQLSNKIKDDGKIFQNVIKDAVKVKPGSARPPKIEKGVKAAEQEVAWDD